jgi:hypothetical protein
LSSHDQIALNQATEPGLLYSAIEHLNAEAPVRQVVGVWRHTAEIAPVGQIATRTAPPAQLQLDRGGAMSCARSTDCMGDGSAGIP